MAEFDPLELDAILRRRKASSLAVPAGGGYDPSDLDAILQRSRPTALGLDAAPAPQPERASSFMRGLVSGVAESNPVGLGNAIEAFGSLTGSETLKGSGKEIKAWGALPADSPYKMAGKSIFDSEDVGQALDALGELAGSAVGSSVVPLVGGVAGGVAGGAVAGPAGAAVGGAAGAAVPSYVLSYGELYNALKEAQVPEEEAAKWAMGPAAAIAAADVAGLGVVTKAARQVFFRKVAQEVAASAGKPIEQGLLKSIAKNAAVEAGTEAGQQTIQEATVATAAPGKDFFTTETGKSILEAGIGGAVGGTALGAPSEVIGRMGAEKPVPPPAPPSAPPPAPPPAPAVTPMDMLKTQGRVIPPDPNKPAVDFMAQDETEIRQAAKTKGLTPEREEELVSHVARNPLEKDRILKALALTPEEQAARAKAEADRLAAEAEQKARTQPPPLPELQGAAPAFTPMALAKQAAPSPQAAPGAIPVAQVSQLSPPASSATAPATEAQAAPAAPAMSEEEAYQAAVWAVQKEGVASISYLQRTLGLSYTQTQDIMGRLEADSIVGPVTGAAPREVNKDQAERILRLYELGKGGDTKRKIVTLNVEGRTESVALTPEQAAEWDKWEQNYKETIKHIDSNRWLGGPSERGAAKKAAGMEWSAMKRKITGKLTARERQAAHEKEVAQLRKEEKEQAKNEHTLSEAIAAAGGVSRASVDEMYRRMGSSDSRRVKSALGNISKDTKQSAEDLLRENWNTPLGDIFRAVGVKSETDTDGLAAALVNEDVLFKKFPKETTSKTTADEYDAELARREEQMRDAGYEAFPVSEEATAVPGEVALEEGTTEADTSFNPEEFSSPEVSEATGEVIEPVDTSFDFGANVAPEATPAPTPAPAAPPAKPPPPPATPAAAAPPPPPPARPVAKERAPAIEDKELSFPKTAERAGLVNLPENYTPITNVGTEQKGRERIERDGVEAAEAWSLEKDAAPSAEKLATATQLTAHFQEMARRTKTSDPQASKAYRERGVRLISHMANALKDAGQMVQYARYVAEAAKFDPDMVVSWAEKKIADINKEYEDAKLRKRIPEKLTPVQANELRSLAEKTQELKGIDAISQKIATALSSAEETLSPESRLQVAQYLDELEKLATEREGEASAKQEELQKKAGVEKKPIEESAFLNFLTAKLDKASAEAEQYLKDKGIIRGVGLPVDIMGAYAIIGAAKVARGAKKFDRWSREMIADFSVHIKPHLRELYGRSLRRLADDRKQARRMADQARLLRRMLRYTSDQPSSVQDPDNPMNQMTPRMKKELAGAIHKLKTLTGNAQLEAAMEINLAIENLEPASIGRKISLVQTMAQLLAPATIMKNVLQNEIMYRAVRASHNSAALQDAVWSKMTGAPRAVHTRGSTNKGFYLTRRTVGGKDMPWVGNFFWDDMKHGARLAWRGISPVATKDKFDTARGRGATFTGKYNPLTYTEKLLSVGLRAADYAGFMRAWRDELAEFGEMDADVMGIKDPVRRKQHVVRFMADADASLIQMANKAGEYATLSDDSALSRAFVGLKKLLNANKDFGLGDLVVKYPKIPGNALMRTLEFSPLGLVMSLKHLARAVGMPKTQHFDRREFLLDFNRALVGSMGATGLGYLLASAGVLMGADDESEELKVKEFRKQRTNKMPYQVNVTALGRVVANPTDPEKWKWQDGDNLVDYNWMGPIALSAAMGGTLYSRLQPNAAEDSDLKYLARLAEYFPQTSVGVLEGEPLIEGVRELAREIGGGPRRDKGILSALGALGVDAAASFAPNILARSVKAADRDKRATYAPDWEDQAINRLKAKLPVFHKDLPYAYKTMGVNEKQKNAPEAMTAFELIFSPVFRSKYKVDPMYEALMTPFAQTKGKSGPGKRVRMGEGVVEKEAPGVSAQIPRIQDKTIEINKTLMKRIGYETSYTFDLTSEDRAELQRRMAYLTDTYFKKLPLHRLKALPPEAAEEVGNEIKEVLDQVSEETREWFVKNRARDYMKGEK